jgi:hypothetical protein
MARVVVWSDEAERFLLSLPGADAEKILRAVEQMAATGRGFIRDMLDGAGTWGLNLDRYVALFVIDGQGALQVRRVRARRTQ